MNAKRFLIRDDRFVYCVFFFFFRLSEIRDCSASATEIRMKELFFHFPIHMMEETFMQDDDDDGAENDDDDANSENF